MTRQAISTGGAPAALAAYSQAIRSGDMVFCAGQLGMDPTTGELSAEVGAAVHTVGSAEEWERVATELRADMP